MLRVSLAARISLAILFVLFGARRPAYADDGGADSGVADAGADAAVLDPRVAQIQALEAGTLDTAIEPRSLFETPLDDEEELRIESLRIRALLRSVDEAVVPVPHGGVPRTPDAGTLRGAIAALAASDPVAWRDRIALERARLSFYELDRARREEILQNHAKRQDAERPQETDEERRAREAEAEHARALEAARAARSESERLVAGELARVIDVDTKVAATRERFRSENEAVVARKDIVLGWQYRVRDAKAAPAKEADATYDALRVALRRSRDELATAIDRLEDDDSTVPALGEDPLAELPPDVKVDEVRERRLAVSHAIEAARQEERALRDARAAALLDEVATLNRERLGLLGSLSPDKRDAITGFTTEGWAQARSEGRHLALILRYHFHVARSWLASPRDAARLAPWRAAATAIGWSLLVIVFVWGRRRSPKLLALVEARFTEEDRAERRDTPGAQRRIARFLARTHQPLEWGCLFLGSWWLLPPDARSLLEIELVATISGWVLGGAFVVQAIDALAAEAPASMLRPEETGAGDIRLRSLQLVGRTVVVFALILLLSARLVGRGTIYSWVLSTCWVAAVPVFLVLVRWWRGVVFDRLDRTRRKSSFQAWVLANRSGWKSFVAAMLGAVQLFLVGLARTVRVRILGFDLARRAHAYVFRRELDRLREGAPTGTLSPLPEAARDALRPDRPYDEWISGPADPVLAGFVASISEGRGRVIALVGARGMGKSSLLHELHRRTEGAVLVTCTPSTTVDDVRAELAMPAGMRRPLVVLDDAHAIVAPAIGGLERFDEMITLARADAVHAIWVLGIDASVWPFLRRARDATPLFDETRVLAPWNETEIGALLAARCRQARVVPRFDDLLDKLPPGADEIDRKDALLAKQLGYERMLWDHVRGNPGLALEAWRASLGEDITSHIRVRPLQVPDGSVLETLPDSLLFILRAILQLGPAALDDVARATRLTASQILDAIRFGEMHGILVKTDDRVIVSWQWLLAVTRLLERRHLLVNP